MSYIRAEAIISLYPNCTFTLNGDTYDGLVWHDETIPKPTEQELAEESERIEVELARNIYQRRRKAEYPSIGDQLDALWKGGTALEEMAGKIQQVKEKYPKPPVAGNTATDDPLQGTNQPD
jgi:hypothetical protein